MANIHDGFCKTHDTWNCEKCINKQELKIACFRCNKEKSIRQVGNNWYCSECEKIKNTEVKNGK